MSFLLDTNAISEPGRPTPDPSFVAWFDAAPETEIFLSVITLGELRRGVALLPPGARRTGLEGVHQAILRRYGRQIIPIDTAIALTWGEITASHRRRGRSPSMSDELIAATALNRNLTVVTRNVVDFEASGCRILSPWSA
ncbi:MAG: type II toxin-antitoxin system VapC family toxin [Caulobacterales bacterium]